MSSLGSYSLIDNEETEWSDAHSISAMTFKEKPTTCAVSVVDANSEDDATLHRQMRVERIFGPIQIFACALTFMSSWEAASGNLYFVFLNGGPSALAWGLIITSLGASAQASSLAEMAAMKPIAGAQYHWTAQLAPQRLKKFITWMQAWITWFAWIGVQIGVSQVTITLLEAIVLINYPTWNLARWQGTLMIWLLTIILSLLNIFTFRAVPMVEAFVGIVHVALWLVWIVVLLVYARGRYNSNTFVWTSTVDSASTSGWSSSFVAWNLGMLTSVWPYVGFDNAAHLSEEVKKAKRAVPMVMFLSIPINAVLAWGFCLVLLYCVQNANDALNAPAGYPLAGITLGVTESVRTTTALLTLALIISIIVTMTCITSTSRLTWAWARDGGLPRSFAIVHEKFHVPVRAIILPSFITCLLAILNIPSTVAFQMFISLGSLGIYVSYAIAIGCMIWARTRGVRSSTAQPLVFGEWRMPERIGLAVNVLAFVYTCYMTVWLCFPTVYPVDGNSMNYSLPIVALVIIVALVLWFIRGRRWHGLSEKVIEIAMME